MILHIHLPPSSRLFWWDDCCRSFSLLFFASFYILFFLPSLRFHFRCSVCDVQRAPPPTPPPPHAASANNARLLQATRSAYWMSPCCTFFLFISLFFFSCTRTQVLEWGDKLNLNMKLFVVVYFAAWTYPASPREQQLKLLLESFTRTIFFVGYKAAALTLCIKRHKIKTFLKNTANHKLKLKLKIGPIQNKLRGCTIIYSVP